MQRWYLGWDQHITSPEMGAGTPPCFLSLPQPVHQLRWKGTPTCLLPPGQVDQGRYIHEATKSMPIIGDGDTGAWAAEGHVGDGGGGRETEDDRREGGDGFGDGGMAASRMRESLRTQVASSPYAYATTFIYRLWQCHERQADSPWLRKGRVCR